MLTKLQQAEWRMIKKAHNEAKMARLGTPNAEAWEHVNQAVFELRAALDVYDRAGWAGDTLDRVS